MEAHDLNAKARPMALVEERMEAYYRNVKLGADLLARTRDELLDELASERKRADDERERQARRLGDLKEQRKKLLDAYYAGAITVELLKEQDRLTQESQAAEGHLSAALATFEQVEATLCQAIALAGDCQAAYRSAKPAERRLMNQYKGNAPADGPGRSLLTV